jgi:hypothetical protein
MENFTRQRKNRLTAWWIGNILVLANLETSMSSYLDTPARELGDIAVELADKIIFWQAAIRSLEYSVEHAKSQLARYEGRMEMVQTALFHQIRREPA